ncbi:MAG TPA: VIT domain-containing protein [Fibrobacteria bacterium]|nr:VIT domain-containing protein [Fibrobacteria bacterium]
MSLSITTLALGAASFLASAPTVLKTDVGPSRCEIWDSTKSAMQALAPEQTEVRAILTDGIAEVEVVQTFISNFPRPAEANYVFPLPHQGSVHGMKYRQEGKWRSAEILPKEKADSLYDSIKTAGGSAARLTQQRADIFTQSMTRIVPGDTVEVRIRLSMPLKYKDGTFEFAFPTMIGSRCCNESTPPIFGTLAGWNPPADVDGPRIRFLVGIQTGFAIKELTSPTHPIRSVSAQAAVDTLVGRGLLKGIQDLPLAVRNAVLLQPLNTFPNSDFVLRFSRASAEFQASSAVWTDPASTRYFRLEVFPNDAWSQGERPDLDVMLLVDRSGSQGGWPMEHEKTIAKQIINRLRTTDRLCAMSFDNLHDFAFADTLRYATGANMALASDFVDNLTARGGTELAAAIKAMTAIPNPTNRHRLFVFLTDGFITNEKEILSHLAGLPDLQVITFGAGDNLNRAFLDEAALIGNGFSTPLVQADDLSARVDEAWSRIESPALTGLRLDTKGVGVGDLEFPNGRTVYKGMSWSVLGRTTATGTLPVDVVAFRSGATDSLRLSATLNLDATPAVGWAVPKLWARARIADLEREEYKGADRKTEIVATSLEHQVLSKYTAFLAWDGAQLEGGTTRALYSTSANVSWSTPILIAEVDYRPDLAKTSAVSGLRLVREGSVWTLRLDSQATADLVRLVDIAGNVVWEAPVRKGQMRMEIHGKLPATVVVQIRTAQGWQGRKFTTL